MSSIVGGVNEQNDIVKNVRSDDWTTRSLLVMNMLIEFSVREPYSVRIWQFCVD